MAQEEENKAESGEGKKDGQRFYVADTGYQFIMSLSKDEMECLGHLDRKPAGDNITAEKIKEFMAANGINKGVDEEAINNLVSETMPGKSANTVLATGIQPVKGEDGKLFYKVEIDGEKKETAPDAKENEDAQIDFHSVQKFINVEPDQEIAVIVPPTKGIPGSTVRGKAVPPTPGNPLLIKPGKNVHTSGTDSDSIVSEIHGRVKIEDDTINVVEEYVVEGDVDFAVGNIRFNGYVEIKGDVLDGFQVSASKGIKIGGNIGASRLISHGNIEFCGMDGQGTGSILCGGSLTANFIHSSAVECWGAMHINVEIRDCMIHCRGSVNAGMLSGGECISLSGVEVKQLGAASGLKTRIHTGSDYGDLHRIEELIEQLEELNETIENSTTLCDLEKLHKDKQHLTASIAEVRNRHKPGANPKVNVHDRIHEGVTVILGNAVEEFNTEQVGPLTLIENTRDGGLRNIPLTALEIHASEIEKGWLEKLDLEQLEREKQEQLDQEESERLEKEALENQVDTEAETPATEDQN